MQDNAMNRHSATTQILHEICALNWHTKYLHKAYTRFYFSVSDRDWLHIEFITCFIFLPILGLAHLKTKSIGLVTCTPFDFNVKTTSKLVFFFVHSIARVILGQVPSTLVLPLVVVEFLQR